MKQNMPSEQMNEWLSNRSVICLEGIVFYHSSKRLFLFATIQTEWDSAFCFIFDTLDIVFMTVKNKSGDTTSNQRQK